MHTRISVSLALAILLAGRVASQTPTKQSTRTQTPATKVADTSTKPAALAAPAVPQCASGQVLVPASLANPAVAALGGQAAQAAAAAAIPSMPTIPSPTGLLIGAAKARLNQKKGDTAAPAAAPAPAANASTATPQFLCVSPAQATAYLQSAQAQTPAAPPAGLAAVSQSDAMKAGIATALAVTPQGMLVTGAVAAAPTAGRAAKSFAGRFSRGDSKESIVRDLEHGKLQLKGIRFVDGSDEMTEGFEQSIALLADALQSVDGKFLLSVPAESDGKSPPDTATAHRRMARLAAHLQLAGVTDARLAVADPPPGARTPSRKAPKVGDARVEIIRLAERKP